MKLSAGIKRSAAYVAAALLAGAVSGFLNRQGIAVFEYVAKPALSPPGWLFAPVWALLYVLIGLAAGRVAGAEVSGARKSRAVELWWLQLALNFIWPFVFFTLGLYWAALAVLLLLWVISLICLVLFYFIDSAAAALWLPYQLWLSFAFYLNLGVALLN